MPPPPPCPFHLIACDVFREELAHYANAMPWILSTERLEMSQHDHPDSLRLHLQEALDRLSPDPRAHAIVLLYGLCGKGIEGLRARQLPVIVPRAHDCLTLFLGCRHRYAALAAQSPPSYWYTPGWNREHRVPGPQLHARLLQEYSERHEDPDLVADLMDAHAQQYAHYQRARYIDLGAGDTAAHCAYARQCAAFKGWAFEKITGDPTLLLDLLHARWDEERFLTTPPGQRIAFSPDARILVAIP